MGNCLVIQGRKEIKVMSVVDGENLKALPPPLSKGAPARVSSSDADAALRAQKQHLDVRVGNMGQLHRLFPSDVKLPSPAADPGAVMRVKLVISKQELRRMLGKDDQAVSLEDMVALMRRGSEDQQQEEIGCCRGWRPALHSIPEGSGELFY
ncbi:uncharacterized protein LOC123396028 [Hordeum vulgare subsp. vulgare]|uniref:Uncharacterized protein n=1 Tax=Hordeum vulgare subsp. vulgare TaxID=112509 RepID=A0A8I6XW88_HORVV|nr:uncharacterized protein LOC123396028 [Hordeum vulgare subsp. vulgare]KAI4991977.1 hypothetical protein ZWY2020_040363 [Hordeum vulgare]